MFLRIVVLTLALFTFLAADGASAQSSPEASEPQTEPAAEESARQTEEASEPPSPKVERSDGDPQWFNRLLARTVEPLPLSTPEMFSISRAYQSNPSCRR